VNLKTTCAVGIAASAIASISSAIAAGSENSASDALQEIVVTATRREESLSKVPISVSAYTQETMDNKGIRDFTDIARFTPGRLFLD
jgi:iron complex outermembrane receptor protein